MDLLTDSKCEGMVQANLRQQEGISAFGTLVHLSRLNHFIGRDFPTAFGLHFQYNDDLSRLLAFSEARRKGIANAAFGKAEVPPEWGTDVWQPFARSDLWEYLPWTLRWCASCMRHGYHSNLFQMPWIHRCPWHRELLIERCRRCNRPPTEGLRSRRPIMECACGIDYVDEMAVLKGEYQRCNAERGAFVRSYLRWCADVSPTNELISPGEFDLGGHQPLRSLVCCPETLTPWHGSFFCAAGVPVRRLSRPSGRVLTRRDFDNAIRCANSLWPGTQGMADLPASFLQPLMSVTAKLAEGAPDTTLTTRERDAFALEPVRSPSTDRSRQDLLLLPVQRVGQGLYLDVRVLHRATYRLLGQLAWSLVTNDPARTHGESGSHHLLLTAIREVLCRAYADAFKHVLGRHVPALYDRPRMRPGSRLPWALVTRNAAGASHVSVAWSSRRPWDEVWNKNQSKRGRRD